MGWKEVELKEVCKIVNGSTPSRRMPQYFKGDINWFTPKDLSKLETKYLYESPEKITKEGYDSCSTTLVPENSLLLTSRAPIGHLAINKLKCCTNQGFKNLVPNQDQVEINFLYYLIKSKIPEIKNLGRGATFKELSKKDTEKIKIPLPPLPIQKKIAAILDAADDYRQKTKALLEKYDQLTQSIFLDMFGDPVRNEKGWETISLGEFGDFKNGLNFSRNEIGNELKYLGVGDFKSISKIDDLKNLSNISLNTFPSDEYLLKNGDLIFVRSNGNRKLVGRCLAIYPGNIDVTFSGFCIRYRLNTEELTSIFLVQLFRNESFKTYMLSGGRGANIQNINQSILNRLKIISPPINKQNQFSQKLESIEIQKASLDAVLLSTENLFQSLLQKAFKGELVK